VPDFQILNSLRDDLIHERKKKIASLEMILSTWEKGEGISTHLNYFKDLINQLKLILKDQRENLLMISSDPFLWVRLRSKVLKIERALEKIEKDKQEIQEIKRGLSIFSDEIEEILEKATQKFTFTLNEVIRESVKIVRTEKDRVLKEKGIKIEERYEDIGERFRLSYKNYKDWQKLISNLIRNGVEAVEQKLHAPSSLLQTGVVGVLVGGKGDEVVIMVKDNGIGMDEKTKETFYKRGFTQGKEAGLGLGITEETVEFVNKYGSWNIESKIDEGTRIEIKIEKEKARKQDLTIEDRSALVIKLKSRRVMFALAGVLVVAIGLGLYFQFNKYARFWEDWNPEFFDTEANHLIVKNKSREILWDIFLPAPIRFSSFDGKPIVRLEDLNADGKTEVLAAEDYSDRNSGKVICFNYKGEELWEFTLGESGIYQIGNELNGGYFYPIAIEAEDLDGDSKKEIIINSGEVRWFPDQVAVLDYNGKKLYEYWHPGIFYGMRCFDLDGDGKKEIILCGINNRMGWRPVLSILDSKGIYGQAMPYIAEKKIEKAMEKWYVVFPDIKKKLPDGLRWESFLSWVTDVRVLSRENKITAWVIDGRNYDLTMNFEFSSIYFNFGGFLDWKKARYFPFDVVKEDEENWKNIEVYKEGVRIR